MEHRDLALHALGQGCLLSHPLDAVQSHALLRQQAAVTA
jgi:hypothetical protein